MVSLFELKNIGANIANNSIEALIDIKRNSTDENLDQMIYCKLQIEPDK